MFASTTARVSKNMYYVAKTRRFSRRSENSVGRVTDQREATIYGYPTTKVYNFGFVQKHLEV